MNRFSRYGGTKSYIASKALQNDVNVAIALGRPLLIKGEPGTGKTLLAASVAEALETELLTWTIKSSTKAQDGLYVYDTVQRLNDARFGDNDISDIKQYIKLGKLGQSFNTDRQVVLLIDEIDKADIEFPNDLLTELDQMQFYIPETGETVAARRRPVVIITSNSEKELPDAFLRRCVFHYIAFPEPAFMEDIVRVHFPDLETQLLQEGIKAFYRLREIDELRKKPSTSELIDWLRALVASSTKTKELAQDLPFLGALLKNEQDYHRVAGPPAAGGNAGGGRRSFAAFR
ncbi:MAG: MoxR family ATPase [Deltaproteobacteria bacterium]|nr:MoxR family ATPase [Candidatus Anaeroferrophillacea bacterium]